MSIQRWETFIDLYCFLPSDWTTCVVLRTFCKVYVYALVEETVCYLSCFMPTVGPCSVASFTLWGSLCPSLKGCCDDRLLSVLELGLLYCFLVLANHLVTMVSLVLFVVYPPLLLLVVNFGYVASSMACAKKNSSVFRFITLFLFGLSRFGINSLITRMTFGCERILRETHFFRMLGTICIVCSALELMLGYFLIICYENN